MKIKLEKSGYGSCLYCVKNEIGPGYKPDMEGDYYPATDVERLVEAARVFINGSSQHIDCDCNQCKLKAAIEELDK